MKPINTAIASFGMSGEVFHAPFLKVLPEFQLTTILERTKERSTQKYPECCLVRSFEEILANSDIELVVVNTPDHMHFEMCKQALEAGKNVIVEKPFVQKVSDGEQLIALAKKKNKILSVFQNRRWDGDFITVQKVINENLLGRLVEYEAHFDRYRNFLQNSWREDASTGTGTLYNLGTHLIDQALVLFGMPNAVTANIDNLRTGSKVDDYFVLWLHYETIKVTLKASYLVREAGPRFILHGNNGSFIKYGLDPQEEMLKAGHLPDEINWGAEEEKYYGLIHSEINGVLKNERMPTMKGNYAAFFKNIYAAIRNGDALAVKPEESLNGIRIIEAAFQSVKEKRSIQLTAS